MGYRSKVIFAINKTEDVALRLTQPQVTEALDCADEMREKCFTDGVEYLIYTWDSIKWYASWPPVTALEAWMRNLDDQYDDYEELLFQFARQGEDDPDLEVIGNWNYGLTHSVYPEDCLLDAEARKALTRVLTMVGGEWGQYMDEDLKRDFELLVPLSNLRQSQEKSDML